ncbi:hypothetical protein ACLB2K_042237 [Fragaria x ananassa]
MKRLIILGLSIQSFKPVIKVNGNNPELKNAIGQCPTPYNEAIADLKEAKEKIRSGDYVALQRAAVDASIKFHACEEKFKDTPPDTSPLCGTSSEFAAISSILIAIFEILAKSYG